MTKREWDAMLQAENDGEFCKTVMAVIYFIATIAVIAMWWQP